ncbi:MAG: DUF4923 family protein [Bacteroidales bacterium]|nr:DUF4923 family protein [Bacteroidales bacterium]
MKKIIAIAAASLILAGSASAQGLGSLLGGLTGNSGNVSDLLNTVTNVVYAFTGNTNAVSLPGTWNYGGAAVSLGSDSVVSNLAGTAVSSGVEGKIDSYLSKIGIAPGVMTFTFNEDLTFVCTIKNIPISGTWKTLNDGDTVQLQFGKTLKFLNLTGSLKSTATGCEVLFESTKFLTFLKSALQYVAKQSSTASTFASLTESYKDMKLGFKLTRVN